MSSVDQDRISLAQGVEQLARLLDAGQRAIAVRGATESALALALVELTARRPASERPFVVVAPTEDEAQSLVGELRFFFGGGDGAELAAAPRVLHLPYDDTSPWIDVTPDRRAILRKMGILFRLSQRMMGDVLVASAPALARRVVPRAGFGRLVDIVQAEADIDREATIALLVRAGYQRVSVVEDPGTFAVRGGVVDVYVPIFRYPARLELDGDRVEKIRLFDPATQRTLRAIDEIFIHPVQETVLTAGNRLRERILEASDHAHHPSSKTRAVLDQIEKNEDFFGKEALTPAFHAGLASIGDYLDAGRLTLVVDPERCREVVDELVAEGDAAYQARLAEGKLAFAPRDFFLTGDEVEALWHDGKQLRAEPLELHGDPRPGVRLAVDENTSLQQSLERARTERHEELLKPLTQLIQRNVEQGVRTLVTALNLQHGERLESLLKGYGIRPLLHREEMVNILDQSAQRAVPEILVGALHRGFSLPADRVVLVAEEEVFGKKAARHLPKAKRAGLKQGALAHLEVGSYVVHQVHGVGVYRGLAKMPMRAAQGLSRPVSVDCIHVEYEGGALYLPVWRLNELQPYKGGDGGKPRVDKLGGLTWEKTRAKVQKEVRQLAEELLQLYAQRRALPGHPKELSPEMQVMFAEFEATFPFEETPDQQKAIDDVLADLEQSRPMDRLVCGDVGYGKTEVAVRAALKAVLAGTQVAVLAPTTVLVEQHAATFRARFAGLPVKVESLSRFRDKKDVNNVLRLLGEGGVDVVVGTHRLLSNDVRWKHLGLLVIDEEQRFGVVHKERLKKMRTQVDVLTMTATPIPRTLHMALMGVRDLSIITTPPADRLAIRTFVARYNDQLVVDGIKKELARGGQVFFVHNRVEDIYDWEKQLKEILPPEVRVVVGHGQMAAEDLEKVMVDFVAGRADVLLCTTIIESGIDIPRANTMFVNRADRFGLAQLYQLRGRIGRSKERAFCYLMIPAETNVTHDAKARLEVLQRFTELGAGFQIASYDLELRGAGDLLGDKQSGVIAAVGFDTYTQLLEEAVASLEGRAIIEERDPEIVCDLPAFIPDDYLPDVGHRLDFYRRFSGAANEQEVAGLVAEVTDRYGPVPDEVTMLADLMRVKTLGRRLQAKTIEVGETRFALLLDERTPLKPEAVLRLVQKKSSLWKLTPDMRLVRQLTDAERLQRLVTARELIVELLAHA